MKIIAITGGIGSGKSVVSKILCAMGYQVYDTDSEAKRIMADSDEIKQSLKEIFGAEAIDDNGGINRVFIAKEAFGNHEKLEALNRVVHPAVIADVLRWSQKISGEICFVETALLNESGLNKVVNACWLVDAPVDVRIERVMRRSGLTAQQVKNRIASQSAQMSNDIPYYIIDNPGTQPLLPQIIQALHMF